MLWNIENYAYYIHSGSASSIGALNTSLSGVVFKRVDVRAEPERSGVCISATPLFYWVSDLGQVVYSNGPPAPQFYQLQETGIQKGVI